MATTDFSRLSNEELDTLYRIASNRPDLMPNEVERNAVRKAWMDRQNGVKPPDNVESDLEASATPITPDPAVKPKAAPSANPRPESTAELRARGETGRNGKPRGSGLLPGESVEEYGQKYRAQLEAERKAKLAQAKPYREGNVSPDADQAEYDSATGLLGDSSLPPMDGYNEVTKEYTTPRQPLHPMIARDRALAAQQVEDVAGNIGQKYGPENEQIYREGIGDGVVDYRAVQSPAEKDRNQTWAQIEEQARFGPPLARQAAIDIRRARDERMQNNPSYVEREIVRWSDATGLPPAQVRRMFDQDREVARTALRDDANAQRAASRQAAKDHWRAVAMLAGGSQNINSGNRAFYNQLAMLPADERQRQLQYALPGGQERAAVDARQWDVAARLAGNAIAGQLGGFAQANNPLVRNQVEQQQLAQQQEQYKWAEDNINANYAWDADSAFASDFTEAERGQAINDLMVRYGPPNGRMTLAEATRIVDNIAAKKKRPRQAAPSGGPGDDAGAMPAVSM